LDSLSMRKMEWSDAFRATSRTPLALLIIQKVAFWGIENRRLDLYNGWKLRFKNA
jgi:hypothetical protein